MFRYGIGLSFFTVATICLRLLFDKIWKNDIPKMS